MENTRGFGRVLQGVVTSNKMDKSVTVQVTRTVRHSKYNKYVKKRAKYCAHDEKNECGMGDEVEIVESRPLSKTKRWRLRSIVEKAKI